MDRLTSKIEYMMKKHPEKVVEFAKHMYKHDPEKVEEMLETISETGHITNPHKYHELVERVKWAKDSGRGERWKIDDLKKYARIDFENVDYTEFDFAYLVNMLYAKCCKEFTDINFYIKLAKCLLEDNDEETKIYRGAEYEKHKHQKHGVQSYYDEYDEYDEENRRGRRRRYRNERSEDYRNDDYRDEDYRYEDYRSDYRNDDYRSNYRNDYDNENRRTRYYRETNVGFRI